MEIPSNANFDATAAPPQEERVPIRATTESGLTALSSLLENLEEAADASPATVAKARAGHENRLVQVRLGLASSLFTALRAKHSATASHSLRVALGCSSWAVAMELPDDQRDILEISALLHDVGKIGIPDHVLLKPGLLSEDEVAVMNQHRQYAQDILTGCCATKEILDAVLYCAAWYSGDRPGFDRDGDDLPLAARMLAVVDAFDAMTTDSVYRRAMSRERALAELFQNAGSQFDPELVESFTLLQSKDAGMLTGMVAGRWLHDLDPGLANSNWQLGQTAVPQTVLVGGDLYQQRLLDNMHDAVIFIDKNLQVQYWNRGAEKLTDIGASSVQSKQWSPELIGMRDQSGQDVNSDECPIVHSILTGDQVYRRITVNGRNGEVTNVSAHVVPVTNDDGRVQGATMLLHDESSVTSLEERVQTLHEKAIRDPLTKVANRAELDRMHSVFVETHLERSLPCSLIICDLDHFKKINDNYGHQAGDDALVNFAMLLKRFCRAGDLVARYGGEEFVMLCADCDNNTATQRAERIRRESAQLGQPSLGGKCVTASFGVTEVQPGDTPETMLRRADRALLQAKAVGRNTVVQLGAGMTGEVAPATGSSWLSWFSGSKPDQLMERELLSTVPLNVVVEKLRGFVADHHAEIASIDQNHVILKIDAASLPLVRRNSDRSVPFVIELTIADASQEKDSKVDAITRTIMQVAIRPSRNRDRRRQDAVERARQLFFSLKSYLMAHELDEESSADSEADQGSGVLGKACDMLSPWRHKD